MAICDHCHSDAVEDDISSGQAVCTVCSVVAKNDVFQYDSTPHYQCGSALTSKGTWHPRSVRLKNGQENVSKSHKLALGQLRNLAKDFKLGEDALGEAERMMIRALAKDSFRQLHADRKTMLVGCCIYAALRNRGCNIQLSAVAKKLQLQQEPKMAFVYRKLKSAFPEEFSSVCAPATSQVIGSFIADTGLKECGCDLEPCIRKILRLAERELISTGVHYKPLLASASYVAWRSQPSNALQKLSFPKFCTTYEVPKSAMCSQRLDEITLLLVKLCRGLPWLVGSEITKKNVFPHVEAVLAHSCLLAKEELGTRGMDLCPRKKSTKRSPEEPPASVEGLVVSNSPELTNEDLPESEMHDYILTAEEVKRREDAMAHFNM